MAIRRICRKLLIFRPHNLCKQGVTGSIPVTSTTFFLIAKDLKKSRRSKHSVFRALE
jgi:hypothetical protein